MKLGTILWALKRSGPNQIIHSTVREFLTFREHILGTGKTNQPPVHLLKKKSLSIVKLGLHAYFLLLAPSKRSRADSLCPLKGSINARGSLPRPGAKQGKNHGQILGERPLKCWGNLSVVSSRELYEAYVNHTTSVSSCHIQVVIYSKYYLQLVYLMYGE